MSPRGWRLPSVESSRDRIARGSASWRAVACLPSGTGVIMSCGAGSIGILAAVGSGALSTDPVGGPGRVGPIGPETSSGRQPGAWPAVRPRITAKRAGTGAPSIVVDRHAPDHSFGVVQYLGTPVGSMLAVDASPSVLEALPLGQIIVGRSTVRNREVLIGPDCRISPHTWDDTRAFGRTPARCRSVPPRQLQSYNCNGLFIRTQSPESGSRSHGACWHRWLLADTRRPVRVERPKVGRTACGRTDTSFDVRENIY